MANANFFQLVIAEIKTLEDLLGGNEHNTQVYTKQCKALVHGFVQVRNSLPTFLEGANGKCSALIFKELLCLARGAVRIVKQCCEEHKWLQAVIIVDVRDGPKWSTFETLRDELDWCFNILKGNFVPAGSSVDRLTHSDPERLLKDDEENLREQLRDKTRSGTSQEVSIANFLLARLDVNNGEPSIQQLNFSQSQYQETVPLIYMIEGPVVGTRRPFVKGEHSSVSRNLTWFGINVAEKAFPQGDDYRKLWEEEAHIMATLNHPHVVSFIGCTDGEEGPAIIMECEDQSLKAYINALQLAKQSRHIFQTLEPPLDLVDAVDLLTQIASGMAYLHGQDVAHLDLKPENLLITSDPDHKFPHVKIADFGLSIQLKGESGKILSPLKATGGATLFRAMELFHPGNSVCLKAADVCSFGFTAWAILHCQEPKLKNVKQRAPFYYDELMKGTRLGFHDKIPEVLRKLVERCWGNNPDERPQFSHIYFVLQSYKAKLLGSNEPLVPLQQSTAQPGRGICLWRGMLCLGSRQKELHEQHEESV